jgi:capsular polysaccharide biosynthesis protein
MGILILQLKTRIMNNEELRNYAKVFIKKLPRHPNSDISLEECLVNFYEEIIELTKLRESILNELKVLESEKSVFKRIGKETGKQEPENTETTNYYPSNCNEDKSGWDSPTIKHFRDW